jgi:hypothetical protein
MNSKNLYIVFLSLFLSGTLLPSGPSEAAPYLEARFKAVSRCNDEPAKSSNWEKDLNWNALDCNYGLLGETPGFSKAHIISRNKQNTVGLQWLTHVRGGNHNNGSMGSANIALEGELYLRGVTQANKDMTFLWISGKDINLPEADQHNVVAAENSFELQGPYYGNLKNLTTF